MPETHAGHPRRRSTILQAFGRAGLRLCGWRIAGAMPPLDKFVVVVAPHTSNWDFPLGALMRALGGEPVDRSQPGDVVEQVAARIREADTYVLGLAPEGTRRARPWKTGFHRIAVAARVPVVPAWIDYGRRTIGIGAPVTMSGELEDDLARLGAHYEARMARYPGQYVGIEQGS